MRGQKAQWECSLCYDFVMQWPRDEVRLAGFSEYIKALTDTEKNPYAEYGSRYLERMTE